MYSKQLKSVGAVLQVGPLASLPTATNFSKVILPLTEPGQVLFPYILIVGVYDVDSN